MFSVLQTYNIVFFRKVGLVLRRSDRIENVFSHGHRLKTDLNDWRKSEPEFDFDMYDIHCIIWSYLDYVLTT